MEDKIIKSKFKEDIKQENILTPIIVNDIIGNFLTSQDFTYHLVNYENDADAQYKGIDFVMKNKEGHSWNVDVKCQTNDYINSPTRTFSIELNYLKNGVFKEGWFVNKDNLTDFYLFVWIHKANLNEDGLINNVNQIEKMELMFVRKQSVVDYLKLAGYSIEDLVKKSIELRNKAEKNLFLPNKKGKEIKLVCTRHLSEKPVNIIISKYIYQKMLGSKHLMYIKGMGLVPYKEDMLYKN